MYPATEELACGGVRAPQVNDTLVQGVRVPLEPSMFRRCLAILAREQFLDQTCAVTCLTCQAHYFHYNTVDIQTRLDQQLIAVTVSCKRIRQPKRFEFSAIA